MTRKEMRDLEEAEVEAALRREVAEVQEYDASRRSRSTTPVRSSQILGAWSSSMAPIPQTNDLITVGHGADCC